MNKKILFGVILFIVAIFMSAGMSLMDAPIPLFFNLIRLIVAFVGVLIISNGIAESKKIFKTYRYYGELNTLLGIVEKSITQMDLKVKNKSITDNSFYFSLSEKIRLLSRYWPVHLDIKTEKSGQMIDLNIHAWSHLYVITQAKHIQKKVQEFLDLVKSYAPKTREYNERDTIDMSYVRGEITKEEYEQMHKDFRSEAV